LIRRPQWYDYVTVNAYWLGLTTLSQTLGLVYPLLVQQFVGEETKGTLFGNLRLWTLMVALLVQALMGVLSDRSTLRWGRRRPFILVGTVLDLACLAAIGWIAGLEGANGYWSLFVVAILLQVTSNIAHAALQGIIPDLVPEELRGRFSAVKAILELPIPVILSAVTVGVLIGKGYLWGGLLVTMGVLTITMLLTMFIPEKQLEDSPEKLNWEPFLRLLLMTGVFTAVILGMGAAVQTTGRLVKSAGSVILRVLVMGGVGLLAMAIAVGLGVWASVRISIGRAAQRYPSFTWWVTGRLAFLTGVTNLSVFAVYFLQGRLGYVEEEAATPASRLMMVVGIFILLSALPSGWLADRFSRKRLVQCSGLVAAAGTGILLLAPSLPVLYVGGSLAGVGAGLFYTANWALGTHLVPRAEAGRYLGISNLAGAGAGAIGAYVGGPIADYFTRYVPGVPGLGYVILFGIYGVLFVTAVLAVSRIDVRPAT
jgi:MFS family permease